MNRTYAESKIREALKNADGNPTRARQQIIAAALEDNRLLQELVRPHMTGIVAHAVNRVIYRQDRGLDETETPPQAPRSLDMSPDTFGKEILKSLQSQNTAFFGHESAAPPVRRKQASQSHIDALNQIARKKKDDR